MRVLVTGAAGFIGYHAAKRCSRAATRSSASTISTPTTTSTLKQARLAQLDGAPASASCKLDLADRAGIERAVRANDRRARRPSRRAGRRALLAENPHAYVDSNLVGFCNMLEGCRHNGVAASRLRVVELGLRRQHASCRSPSMQNVDHPVSLYAATKKANELMAHTYAISSACRRRACASSPSTGRGAGPTWRCSCSRAAILAGEPIDVFNHGQHARDFTYIDDIVEGVLRTARPHRRARSRLDRRRIPTRRQSSAPYRLYNIGNHTPGRADATSSTCSKKAWARKAEKNFLPMQPGDVPATFRRRRRSRRRRRLCARDADRGRRRAASSSGIATIIGA